MISIVIAAAAATGAAATAAAQADANAALVEPLRALTQAAPGAPAGPLSALGVALVLGAITLLPALVLSCTNFVRFVVVLGFVRTGLGAPSAPPTQILVGLALFMTAFASAPLATRLYDVAAAPYLAGKLDERGALAAATPPLRDFLVRHTSEKNLELFYSVSDAPRPTTIDDVPLRIAIPAFILSELTTAFAIGLSILLPFLVIDLVAATVLTALGMVMLPPQVVSLPLKLLVFALIDGWHVIVESLLRGAMS